MFDWVLMMTERYFIVPYLERETNEYEFKSAVSTCGRLSLCWVCKVFLMLEKL